MLKYANDLCLFWLQEAEEAKDYLRKESRDLRRTITNMHKEIAIKSDKIKVLKDEVSYFKCKTKLMEDEIANKVEEKSSLKEKSECTMLVKKVTRLEAALKIRRKCY